MLIDWFLPTQVEDVSPLMNRVDWEREKSTAVKCEEYGFNGIAVPDHLQLGLDANFEAFVSLTSLAECTEKVDLLTLVASVPFRNPALTAKMAATLDVVSGGRFQLGLGAGWNQNEFRSYGYEFEEGKVRVDRLEEAAEIINRLWNREKPSFEGDYYEIKECICDPKPLDPYLLIGGGGQRIQRLAEKYANEWNFPVDLEEGFGRVEEVEGIDVSWFGGIIVSRDEDLVEEMKKKAYPKSPGRCMGGTPEEITEKLKNMEDRGIKRVMFQIIDYPKLDSIRLLGEEVIPEL